MVAGGPGVVPGAGGDAVQVAPQDGAGVRLRAPAPPVPPEDLSRTPVDCRDQPRRAARLRREAKVPVERAGGAREGAVLPAAPVPVQQMFSAPGWLLS